MLLFLFDKQKTEVGSYRYRFNGSDMSISWVSLYRASLHSAPRPTDSRLGSQVCMTYAHIEKRVWRQVRCKVKQAIIKVFRGGKILLLHGSAIKYMVYKTVGRDWREGSGVKSMRCSCRGPVLVPSTHMVITTITNFTSMGLSATRHACEHM